MAVQQHTMQLNAHRCEICTHHTVVRHARARVESTFLRSVTNKPRASPRALRSSRRPPGVRCLGNSSRVCKSEVRAQQGQRTLSARPARGVGPTHSSRGDTCECTALHTCCAPCVKSTLCVCAEMQRSRSPARVVDPVVEAVVHKGPRSARRCVSCTVLSRSTAAGPLGAATRGPRSALCDTEVTACESNEGLFTLTV